MAGGAGRGVSVGRGADGRLRRGGASSAWGAERGGRGVFRRAAGGSSTGSAGTRSSASRAGPCTICGVTTGVCRAEGSGRTGRGSAGTVTQPERSRPERTRPVRARAAMVSRFLARVVTRPTLLARRSVQGSDAREMARTDDNARPAVAIVRGVHGASSVRRAGFVGSVDAAPGRRPSASADAWWTDALTALTGSRAAEHPVQQFRQSLPYGLVVRGCEMVRSGRAGEQEPFAPGDQGSGVPFRI